MHTEILLGSGVEFPLEVLVLWTVWRPVRYDENRLEETQIKSLGEEIKYSAKPFQPNTFLKCLMNWFIIHLLLPQKQVLDISWKKLWLCS